MKACPECGQQRPRNVEPCPHCGATHKAIESGNVKRLIALVLVLAVAGLAVAGARHIGALPVAAAPSSQAATVAEPPEALRKLNTEYCAGVSTLATTVMTGRQQGADMAKMIELAGPNEATRYVVVQAFEQPHWRTPEHQRESVQDFANDMYLECLKGRNAAR